MTASKAYSQDLVEKYDYHHFGGKSGQYILQKDLQALLGLLPPSPALLLDIPCGTGVYMDILRNHGYRTIAADASWSMLKAADLLQPATEKLQSDVTCLPLVGGTLDAVVTLRLFSHFPSNEIVRSLKELRRLIKPGGLIIFDSFRWTPRRWPIARRFLAQDYIHEHTPEATRQQITAAGLRIVDTRWTYLFSPIWQRKLPLPVLDMVTRVEEILPEKWLLRTFWACTRN